MAIYKIKHWLCKAGAFNILIMFISNSQELQEELEPSLMVLVQEIPGAAGLSDFAGSGVVG